MMRRSSVTLGFLIVSCGAALAQPACPQLTITGHPEYPPFGYSSGGEIAGAGATLVAEIGMDLGIPVVSVDAGSWEDAQAATRTGAADVIFGIYYNEERATYLDYVQPPFAIDPVVVFVPADSDIVFTGRESLIGLQGVTNVGESFGEELDAYIEGSLNVARSDGVGAAFDVLLAGDADYMIFGLYPGLAQATQDGFLDEIETLSPNLLEADMFVAFSEVSPCLSLIEPFGEAIDEMRSSGHIDDLIDEAGRAWEAGN